MSLSFNYNLLFVGRLVLGKRIELLLETFVLLRKIIKDVSLIIIGDGPKQSIVKEYMENHSNIIELGVIYDEELVAKYLYASDLQLHLGYVG